MKYLYLLYADENNRPAPGSPEMTAVLDAYGKFYEEITGAGVMTGGDPVQPSTTATTVRVRDGAVQKSSGPFAPGGEQIVGFYVLDCATEADAIAYGAKIPAAGVGAVEVRPILVQS
jgi:hypothetical protein